MAEPFQHTALSDPKESIRLVHLIPPPETSSAEPVPLRFTLFETPLSEAPKYWALSYAWESQSFTDPAIVNLDYTILLTANCHAALSQLASEPASRKQPIWVDAICIDQSSVTEKNHQVGLMSSIYSGAANVVIWLGEGDEEAHRQMRDLNRLATLAKLSTKIASTVYHRRERKLIRQLAEEWKTQFELLGQTWFDELDPFERVMQAVWFSRVWTLQEVVLARKAMVRMGAEHITWERLVRVADAVATESSEMGFTLYSGGSFSRLRVASSMKMILKEGSGGAPEARRYRLPRGHPLGNLKGKADKNGQPGLSSHFFTACTLEANDPRDKAYGQYAILQKHGVQLSEPDYGKPLNLIYAETARAVINHNSSLELLCDLSLTPPIPECPSWVPVGTDADSNSWVPGYEFCAAAGESVSKGHYRFDDDGLFFKRKSKSFKYALHLDENRFNNDALVLSYRHLQELIRFGFRAADIKGNKLEAFTMVLLQEMALSTFSSKRKWAALQKRVKTWAKAMMECYDSDEPVGLPQTKAPDDRSNASNTTTSAQHGLGTGVETLDRILAHFSIHPASKSLSHTSILRFDSSCLFVTDGGLLGVAIDEAVQEGDGIYLIPGVRLPVIIRKEVSGHAGSGGFRLMVCPFVHGMMKGELWDPAEGWESQLEELRIV
ncbi:heterokaryon incompatibility protein-domain-containing protein [Cladorrhinum sp. PSN332]|nr:heterokaryon incompatibility protein-domain-containing protein [Cladorrhinum sp. PSN332]